MRLFQPAGRQGKRDKGGPGDTRQVEPEKRRRHRRRASLPEEDMPDNQGQERELCLHGKGKPAVPA